MTYFQDKLFEDDNRYDVETVIFSTLLQNDTVNDKGCSYIQQISWFGMFFLIQSQNGYNRPTKSWPNNTNHGALTDRHRLST